MITPERWQQIKRLYHAALTRDADQRAAFLRGACPTDDALRHEVESLLAQEGGADGLLETAALEAAAKTFGESQSQSLIGRQLGCYQVISLLGAGGMGAVYQAHDSKLGRDVAIKVLPERFAQDPERLARFQREAKMLASLNHPNIAAIYGLEQSDSTHYLVMELVRGDTLQERVAGGRPVPIEEALMLAKQIAEGLEAAHNSEKAIVHRDLKPANVKVTPEGRVKILDFGLAKAFAADTASENFSNLPTLSINPTLQGAILGTPAYMSPEQARGKSIDKRTDIWAFGCVLFRIADRQAGVSGRHVVRFDRRGARTRTGMGVAAGSNSDKHSRFASPLPAKRSATPLARYR